METIRCRVEIYPKKTVVPGIRIRIPESYVKRLVKSEPPYPQLSITTKGLEKEFAIQQLIIAVDTDFFLPEGKQKHQNRNFRGVAQLARASA